MMYNAEMEKVIPTVRGAGIFQESVDIAIGKLNEGKWVHMFPGIPLTVYNALTPNRRKSESEWQDVKVQMGCGQAH